MKVNMVTNSLKFQVMWSTFIPYVPNTILPGSVAFVLAAVAVVMVKLLLLFFDFSNFCFCLNPESMTNMMMIVFCLYQSFPRLLFHLLQNRL